MTGQPATVCRSCEAPLTFYNRAANGQQCETCESRESHNRDWAVNPARKEGKP